MKVQQSPLQIAIACTNLESVCLPRRQLPRTCKACYCCCMCTAGSTVSELMELSTLQGSHDGVIDLAQPTQMYQPTLTTADCQPSQTSLQQTMATGVFMDDDDGDEVICIE